VLNRPLILAHRGDRINAIENTIQACELALEKGANALEIDIRETSCGEIVVFHDFSLKRMFSKAGYVGRISLKDLKAFPYHTKNKQNPQYIETLDAFLHRFKNRIPLNLDAKTIHFFDFKFADKIISIIRNHDLLESVWISCFNPFLLQILKLKNKRVRTGYLFQRMTWLHTSYDKITWTDAWHPHYRVVNKWLVKKAIKNKKEIYVWTVNEIPIVERLLRYPINGIITDEVSRIKNYLSSHFD
jgi:glycerophosphoryl diester phosphodiesterase